MAVFSEDVEERRAALRQGLEFFRTTVIGGALFLLPIFVVFFVLVKIFGLMGQLTEPVVHAMGVTTIAGVAAGNIVTMAGLVGAAFLAGLFARTDMGQAALTWIREGVAATIPQFSLIQDVARNVGSAEDTAEMPVVLVPTDAGWQLGLLLEAEGDWHAVFLPGAPEMSSGSISYVHTDDIHRTDLTLQKLWVLLRARGKGSATVFQALTGLPPVGK